MKPKLCNPREVLVEVKAASVNPVDIQTCTGRGHHWLNHCRKKQGVEYIFEKFIRIFFEHLSESSAVTTRYELITLSLNNK